MTFYGFHGVSRAEQETGRRFEVDCELHIDITRAALSDKLTDTVNYTSVYDRVEQIVQRNKFNLLETVAARIAGDLLASFDAQRVIVRVRKKIPPIPGHLDHIEVEFDTATDAAPGTDTGGDQSAP
jgi:dihydroneopterin aldolase